MLEISKINTTNFEISDIEIKREGISYTVDTLEEFVSSSNLDKKDLFFLMGSDTLRSFHTWKDPERIMELCNIIVAIRPGFTPSDIPQLILDNVRLANIPRFEVSSTNIKARWREGKTKKRKTGRKQPKNNVCCQDRVRSKKLIKIKSRKTIKGYRLKFSVQKKLASQVKKK